MKEQFTRLARGSAVYGVGGILQRFIGIFLLPLYTRVLTPSDYGVVALVTVLMTALSGLFTLGTGSSMGMMYFRENDPARRAVIVWTCSLLLLLNAAALFGLVVLLSPWLSQWMFETAGHAQLLNIACLTLVLTTVVGPFYSHLMMAEKATTYVMLTAADSLLTSAISLYLVLHLRLGIEGVLLAGLVSKSIMAVAVWALVARPLPFAANVSLVGGLVRAGFPSIFGLFAFMIIDFADRQMLQRMVGIEQLGIYSIGYNFGMMLLIVVGAFGSAWAPYFMSFIQKQDEAGRVFGRVLTYYILGFGGLVVVFFAAAKPVVLSLTAPAYHDAYIVVGLAAAAYMLKGCYVILLPGVYYAEKLHLQSGIEWIAAVINVGLNLLLIPAMGITGAAIATLASYVCLTVLAWLVSRRFLAVEYEWARVAMVTILIVTACSAAFVYSDRDSLPALLTTGGLVLVGYAVLAFFGVLNQRERRVAFDMIRSFSMAQ